jgi:hypothetical protein
MASISEEEDEQERRACVWEEEDEQQQLLQKQHPNVCEREEGVTEHGLHTRPAGVKLYTVKAKVGADDGSVAGGLHTRVCERVVVDAIEEQGDAQVVKEGHSVREREVEESSARCRALAGRALIYGLKLKRFTFHALQDHLERGFRISVRATRLCWQRQNKMEAKVLLAYMQNMQI